MRNKKPINGVEASSIDIGVVLEADLPSCRALSAMISQLADISGGKVEKKSGNFSISLFKANSFKRFSAIDRGKRLIDLNRFVGICQDIGRSCVDSYSMNIINTSSPFVASKNNGEIGIYLQDTNDFRCLKFNISQAFAEAIGSTVRTPEDTSSLLTFSRPYLHIADLRSSVFRGEIHGFEEDPNGYIIDKLIDDFDCEYDDELIPEKCMLPKNITFNGISIVSKLVNAGPNKQWLGENTGHKYDPVTGLRIVTKY